MTFTRGKIVVFSLLPAVLLLLFLELGARVAEIWLPPMPVDYGWGFDAASRLFIPSKQLPGWMVTNPAKEVSFQEQEFKMPKPPNLLRVFAVGGSSVRYARKELLQLAFDISVKRKNQLCEMINAGGCAYGTHRLAPLTAELLNYQPDLVLLFTGHNEFEEREQMQLVRPAMVPLQKILYKSAFCRFVRDRFAGFEMDRRQREKNAALLRMDAPDVDISGTVFPKEEIDARMKEFREYLSAIVSLCQTRGVPIILGTAPSNLWRPDVPDPAAKQRVRELFDAGKYKEGLQYARQVLRNSSRHQASDTENEIIREVAKKYAVPLADVEAAIIAAEPHHVPGETLFEDRCHFTHKGDEILCNVFKEQILSLLQKKP